MNENVNNGSFQQEESTTDFKQVFSVVWGLKWYMLATALIALAAAFCYIKVTRTQYTANAKIMVVNKDNIGSAEVAVISDITGMSKTNKAINEIEVIKSNSLMQRVVEDLGLNYTYVRSRFVKSVYYDYGCEPFQMLYNGVEKYPEPQNIHIQFEPVDSLTFKFVKFTVNDQDYAASDAIFRFGSPIKVQDDYFILEVKDALGIVPGEKYEVIATNSFRKACSMAHNLTVTTGKTMDRSDIIHLTYVDILPKRCEAILNSLIFQYNEDARNFRNQATTNTLNFLDERLAFIEDELSSIEGKFQSYRRDNTLVNVDSQSQLTLTSDERYEAQLNEVMIQIELLAIVRDYLNQMKDAPSVIPANIGITDAGLNATINQYNALILERNRMAASSSESNPLVITADNQIADLITSIDASVRNLDRSYKVQQDNIKAKLREGRQKISNIPTQQLALSNFSRQQQIKEPLYILLQQKREEAMIALFSVTDQCKVVDSATGTARATAPNKKMIMLLALLLGLCIPPALFFLRQTFKLTVTGKSDITSRTKLPLLASVPRAEGEVTLIRSNGREPFEEAVRVMRSQFRYFPHRVYQVLSSTPSEGKTFISTNISIALAHAGKKVLLMGVDLRKPRLYAVLGSKENDPSRGVVSYLIGKVNDPEELIVKNVKGIENLDVIFAGSVPPNPSELIESDKMKELMAAVRAMSKYDYIILDSCPYLSVADSTIINDYVDANIFVMRSGVTALKFVSDLDGLVADGKLKNVSLVLNDVNVKERSYGYYNGYGYGKYGYGKYGDSKYGYGYGYGEDSKSSKA